MIKKIVKNFSISVPGHFKQNSSQNNDGYCAFHGAGFFAGPLSRCSSPFGTITVLFIKLFFPLCYFFVLLFRGFKIYFCNPASHREEHFYPDPAGFKPSCSSSPPTDGEIIAFTMLIMYSHYAEK